jgi:aspartyl-tRNA(Asn)/glutamyl-tRNA(Gln) amidotransferase subunit B
MKYETVIGLEVHVELCTATKIFCACKNEFGAGVNTNCCPGCLAMPGALPVLNERVVDFAVKTGLALNCTINKLTKHDRKNYFYPDLTKGYQITQFDYPICEGGYLDFIVDDTGATKRVRINRAHIEEDTGKMLHDDSFDGTLIDLNRCGVPLIEIVTEPDLRCAADAKAFLETLKAALVAIGVCDGKMQEGSIRCDVNVSVRPEGQKEFGTRVEMKNVNTFSGAMRAIEYESNRQIEAIGRGEALSQETRRWDDLAGVNFLMRSKEDAQDYRYFPEPDLLSLVVADERIETLRAELPELPHHKVLRYMKEYSLPLFDANLLVENPAKGEMFVQSMRIGTCGAKNISNWILGEVSRILNEKNLMPSDTRLTPAMLCEMVKLVEDGKISNTAGKTVLETIMFEDKTPMQVVEERGLMQISDTSALEAMAKAVLDANPHTIEQYKSGKTNVLAFLVGQCMKQSKGQGNPALLREILLKMIGE